ncbi:glycoside hydrolase [Hypoxylon crocopeplum]|nr:glycoside hydrolase [Hypoxylon crocopeplum]
MAKISTLYSSWLTSLLVVLAALAPITSATTTTSATVTRPSGTSPTPSSDSKRIVQYAGTIYAPGSHQKIRISELVNSTRPIFATNVLYGTWSLWTNRTMTIQKDQSNVDPSLPSNAWAFAEMKTVQKAGVKVSMFMRGGWTHFNNVSTFNSYYSVLHDALRTYGFDGVDMDIEDYTDHNPSAIGLDAVVRLIKRLRADFGPDFVITLAPVSTALAGGSNLSKFSYEALEQRCGADISWYNVQFYYQPDELASTGSVDAVVAHGWKPERVAVGMMTTPDFPDVWVAFPQVAQTLRRLVRKYPGLRGVDGFDYYDQKPGGYANPWEWPRWAARQLGMGNGTAGASASSGAKMLAFKA